MADPTRYSYAAAARDLDQLHAEVAALALPGFIGLCASGATVEALFAAPLAAAGEQALAAAVRAHVPDPLAAIKRLRTAAGGGFGADSDPAPMLARAVILAALDEINLLRQWLADLKAQVAAATSLADLKARVALLPDTPDRSALQAKSAVAAKIDSGGAD